MQGFGRFMLALMLIVHCTMAFAQSGTAPQQRITSISWVNGALQISCSGEVQFTARSLSAPYRLMVDIQPCQASMNSVKLPTDQPATVKSVRLGQFTEQIARVVVDLKNATAYTLDVSADKQSATLHLGSDLPSTKISIPPVKAAKIVAPAPKLPSVPATTTLNSNNPPSPPKANMAGVAQMISFDWDTSGSEAKLIMQFDSPVSPKLRALDDGYGVKLELNSCLVAPGLQVNKPISHPLVDRYLVAPIPAKRTIGMVFASRKPCAVDIPVTMPSDTVVLVIRTPKPGMGQMKGTKICIDPGHGGFSAGAVGRGNSESVLEKDVTLAISRKLADALKARGADVVMTREGDQFVELDRRPSIAVEQAAHMFISIHCDSNQKVNSASGSTSYFHAQDGDGRALAQAVLRGVVAASGLPSRGVRSDTQVYATGFAVLRRSQIPSMLLETAFINNAADRSRLIDPAWQSRVANAIAAAVDGYLAGTEVAPVIPAKELAVQDPVTPDTVTSTVPVVTPKPDVIPEIKPVVKPVPKVEPKPKPAPREPEPVKPAPRGDVQNPENLEE
ncbi:MAG: N-acetylmuramoyl-L-alanine amidase [Armatimonadota bacterium]